MKKKLLLEHQSSFIQAPFLFPEMRFHFLVAGYGSGKTSALATLVEYLVMILQGKRDREGHKPLILLTGVNMGHLIKTTVAYVLADFENSKTPIVFDKKNNRLLAGDVEIVLASNSDPGALVGFSAFAALADEIDDSSSNDEVPFEMVRAMNERTRQIIPGMRKPMLCFASTAQGQRALYRVVTNFKKSGTAFTLLRGRTHDNFYLDPDYVKSLEKIYTEKERLVFLEGHFIAVQAGRVFPGFDWDNNYIDEPMDLNVREDEPIYYAQDVNSGYCRGTAAIVRGGIVYAVKSYDFPDLRTVPQVLRYDWPRNKVYFLPDAANSKEVLTFAKELRKYNIVWVHRSKNPSVEDSVFCVDKLLYTRRLIFSQAARDTAEAVAGFMRDKNNAVPPGKTPLDHAHFCIWENEKVILRRGRVRIKDVRVGDEALTRKGYRKVIAAYDRGVKPVYSVAGIGVTIDHPFYTIKDGMKKAELLTKEDVRGIISMRRKKAWILQGLFEEMDGLLNRLCGMEDRSTDTRIKQGQQKGDTFWAGLMKNVRGFTWLCGSFITGLFLLVIIYTIKTRILTITLLKILSALLRKNILAAGGTKIKERLGGVILLKLLRRLRRGIEARKEKYGIVSIVERYTSAESIKYTNALSAERSSGQEIFAEESIARPPVKKKIYGRVLSIMLRPFVWIVGKLMLLKRAGFTVSRSKDRIDVPCALKSTEFALKELGDRRVYDLSVEGEHEFFAGDVLVSNCDSVRWLSNFLVLTQSSLRDILRATVGRKVIQEKNAEDVGEVEELAGGYAAINPGVTTGG